MKKQKASKPAVAKAATSKAAKAEAVVAESVQPIISNKIDMINAVSKNRRITKVSDTDIIRSAKQGYRSPSLWSLMSYLIQTYDVTIRLEEDAQILVSKTRTETGTIYRMYKSKFDAEPWYTSSNWDYDMKKFVSAIYTEFLEPKGIYISTPEPKQSEEPVEKVVEEELAEVPA